MPGTIAILGASTNRSKFGNKAVRAYAAEGWTVYPINTGGGSVEGLGTAKRLSDLEVRLDRISVYLPPAVTLEMLPEIAAADPSEVWFNPGSADERVLEAAHRLDLSVHAACSIVDIGRSPSQFP